MCTSTHEHNDGHSINFLKSFILSFQSCWNCKSLHLQGVQFDHSSANLQASVRVLAGEVGDAGTAGHETDGEGGRAGMADQFFPPLTIPSGENQEH